MDYPKVKIIKQSNRHIYKIIWSKAESLDKINIITKVPEMSGILGIYTMYKRYMVPLFFSIAYKQGIRSFLLRILNANETKKENETLVELNQIVMRNQSFYRYVIISDKKELDMTYGMLISNYKPPLNAYEHNKWNFDKKYYKLIEEEIKD